VWQQRPQARYIPDGSAIVQPRARNGANETRKLLNIIFNKWCAACRIIITNTKSIIVHLFLPETYTGDPEYLLSLADVDVDVEIPFIGNTIGVSTPFAIADAS